jgi:flagellar protein FlaG
VLGITDVGQTPRKIFFRWFKNERAVIPVLLETVSMAVKNSNPLSDLGVAAKMVGQGQSSPAPKKSAVEGRSAESPLKDLAIVGLRNVNLNFSVNQSSGQIVISVVDKDTGEVIREIPPEVLQDLATRFQKSVGLVFDHKA